jgi:WD40 repeat protein
LESLRSRLLVLFQEGKGTRPNEANRKVEAVGAAALTLYVRCFEPQDIPEGLLRGCYLPGLKGAGQDFRGLDLAYAVLRDSDLRGADLSRANLEHADLDDARLLGTNLRGANLSHADLRNAELGKLDASHGEPLARNGMPTDFSRATLSGTNMFNFRIVLEGFRQYWDARLLNEGTKLLLSTNLGDLRLLDLQNPEQPEIGQSAKLHEADVVAFELRPDRDGFATAGRDGIVRVFEGDPLSSEPGDRNAVSLDHFAKYPRRVAFSENGNWIVMVDRAAQVYIRRVESLREIGCPDGQPYSEHTGPIMCLERSGTGDSEFFTAGYDGRLFCFRPPAPESIRWRAEDVLGGPSVRKTGQPPTIRALCLRRDAVGQAVGVWIGDETQTLHYHDFTPGKPSCREPLHSEIFSIASTTDGRHLAVGLANGDVVLYGVEFGNRVSLSVLHRFQMKCRYIVRWLYFAEEPARLISVSWSGRVSVWSLAETDRRLVFEFDMNEDGGQPEKDRDKLVFRDTDVSQIEGLSLPFRQYLEGLA